MMSYRLYACPSCNVELPTISPFKGEMHDTLSTCPVCGSSHHLMVTIDSTQATLLDLEKLPPANLAKLREEFFVHCAFAGWPTDWLSQVAS